MRRSADDRVFGGLRPKSGVNPTAQSMLLIEPYTASADFDVPAPGDYDVPKLIGNKSIVMSSLKTQP